MILSRGLGSIELWLQSVQAEITVTKLFEPVKFPQVKDIDLLIFLGGPMSVNDQADLPWLVSEKRFIRHAIEMEKAVVGICLGAQLIASAMGPRVYPSRKKDLGWFPVFSVQTSLPQPLFAFPPELLVFHLHGETFDLPTGAIQLARSKACEKQVFQLGQRVIGLQFHLETTSQSMCEIVSNCNSELVPSSYVQSEEQILAVQAETYNEINSLMSNIFGFVTRKVSG